MLGAIFRGAFLLGILAWYSSSVWKLIDDYFKDQFRIYLEEEYRKNPRMRSDVQNDAVGKVAPAITTPPPLLEATTTPLRNIVEACERADCSIETAENDSASNEPSQRQNLTENEKVTGGDGEKEDASRSIDKNAFQETESEIGSNEPTEGKETRRSISQRDLDPDGGRGSKPDVRSSWILENSRKRSSRYKKKRGVSRDAAEERKSSKRRRVRTITLTEEDFETVNPNADVSDDDFWEFEEDGEEKAPLEGILVSKLPFKPRAELGDLERVTADEYCPLTLEDEPTCGETFEWP